MYVPLTIQERYARAQSVSTTQPEGLFIRGEVTSSSSTQARIEYGIESYFVEEGHGLELEQLRGDELEVKVAISNSGKAVIKELLINGEQYDQ